MFFKCPSTPSPPLRAADARYAALFAGLPAASRERLRDVMIALHQNLLAENVKACAMYMSPPLGGLLRLYAIVLDRAIC